MADTKQNKEPTIKPGMIGKLGERPRLDIFGNVATEAHAIRGIGKKGKRHYVAIPPVSSRQALVDGRIAEILAELGEA